MSVSAEDQVPPQTSGTAPAPGPLFLVSMPRGGSTLLYALLNKHPQVALMYEADLVILRSVFLKPKAFCDWAERWQFFNDVFRRHELSPADVTSEPADFVQAFTATHQLFARRKGATIWGDKSPNYTNRLNRMADDFPEARFIILWRDPKDTANAILRAAATGIAYFGRPGAVLHGLLGYETLKQECDRLVARGKPVCQVNYEDLISDTPSVMRQVCNFLNIPYDSSLSNLQGADRSAIFEGHHHAYIRGDKIVRGPRPEHVNSALRAKIGGYLARWHQLYGTSWPPYPRSADHSVRPLNRISRAVDSGVCRVFHMRDQIVALALVFAPMSLLQRNRQRQERGRERRHRFANLPESRI